MADKNFVVKNGLVVNTAFSANSSGLYFNDTLSVNSSVYKGTANNTSFVGTISAANVVSNAQLQANLANYTINVASVVAASTSNNSNHLSGKSEINLNVNSAVYSTNATYAVSAGSIASGSTISTSSSYGTGTPITGISPTAKRIKVLVVNVMGSPYPVIQLGYDGNWLTNGYDGVSTFMNNSGYGSGQFYQGFVGFYGYYAVPVSGVLTIDEIDIAADDRVLFKDQTDPAQNGVWLCTTAGAPGVAAKFSRDNDMDEITKFPASIVQVSAGTINGGQSFTTYAKATETLGLDPLVWNTVVQAPGTGLAGDRKSTRLNSSHT